MGKEPREDVLPEPGPPEAGCPANRKSPTGQLVESDNAGLCLAQQGGERLGFSRHVLAGSQVRAAQVQGMLQA